MYNLPLPSPSSTSSIPPPSDELPTRGPCYACVFPPLLIPETPLSDEQIALQGTGACSDEGVLGLLCGVVGLAMGSEGIRVLLGIGESSQSRQGERS